jgi:hypothetical protein
MNKRITSATLLAAVLFTGCTNVVSAMPTTNTVNGDAWYTTAKMFKSKVYYCPAPTRATAGDPREALERRSRGP